MVTLPKLGDSCSQLWGYLQQKELGLKTGIPAVDKQLLGLQGFVGLLGAPKSRKSTLLLQIALHNAQQGVVVRISDVENGIMLTLQRALCHMFKCTIAELHQVKESVLVEMCRRLSQLPLFYTSGMVSIDQIEQDVDNVMLSYPGQKMLLAIDSLQAVQSELKDIRASMDSWLLRLDNLKLKYDPNLVILLTVEKRRGTYDVADRSAAKESGKVEYRLEQQLDIREDGEYLILESTQNRRGPRMDAIRLRSVMKDSQDPWSSLFTLEAVEPVSL